VAAALEEEGATAEVRPARDAGSLDGLDAVVLGTPLYMGALHKDVRALLEKDRGALAGLPWAVFALGPVKAGDGPHDSREQLLTALAKVPAPVSRQCS